jgi:hypothetical protein
MASTPQLLAFDRRLIQIGDRMLIESTCMRCGAKVIGTITETLLQDEADHVSKCPRYGLAA